MGWERHCARHLWSPIRRIVVANRRPRQFISRGARDRRPCPAPSRRAGSLVRWLTCRRRAEFARFSRASPPRPAVQCGAKPGANRVRPTWTPTIAQGVTVKNSRFTRAVTEIHSVRSAIHFARSVIHSAGPRFTSRHPAFTSRDLGFHFAHPDVSCRVAHSALAAQGTTNIADRGARAADRMKSRSTRL